MVKVMRLKLVFVTFDRKAGSISSPFIENSEEGTQSKDPLKKAQIMLFSITPLRGKRQYNGIKLFRGSIVLSHNIKQYK